MRNDRVRGREGLGRRQHQYTGGVDLLTHAPFSCVLVCYVVYWSAMSGWS